MKIVIVNGSPNRDGNTVTLLKAAEEEWQAAGIEVIWLHAQERVLAAKHPFCTACSNPCSGVCFRGTALEEAFRIIGEADAVLWGSPVYFGSVSAQLKAFFDKTRQVRGTKAWLGIPTGVVTVGASKYGGQETTTRALHDLLLVQGMTIVGDGYGDADCGHFGASAQRPAANDSDGLKRAKILARRLAAMAKLGRI
ncbi:flavodoxin family protein [Heliophilum fasciatum]|uniref:Multimeric flavodoxin WrbA n=1 Tax=Heliophilum fasciatum TaxID=35700 RepID=A0A4R2RHY4_9FIRM|nr:flavodoxin family protein [Heliophilum fasciatum]MCW2278666.1 multimeric flavodoxin WrbA [Heliophilum fasciatum]TCP62613.1 multimeric flavodoxin WrbA [Heliophilum fasciatum]